MAEKVIVCLFVLPATRHLVVTCDRARELSCIGCYLPIWFVPLRRSYAIVLEDVKLMWRESVFVGYFCDYHNSTYLSLPL